MKARHRKRGVVRRHVCFDREKDRENTREIQVIINDREDQKCNKDIMGQQNNKAKGRRKKEPKPNLELWKSVRKQNTC